MPSPESKSSQSLGALDGLRHAQNPYLDLLTTNNTKKVLVNASDQQDIEDTTNTKKVIVNAFDQQHIEDTTDLKKNLKHSKRLPLGPQLSLYSKVTQ